MILIVTNKQDYTADFLILELRRRGVDYVRFNTEDFPQAVDLLIEIDNGGLAGQLRIYNRSVALGEIHSIWYRRPLPSESAKQLMDPGARELVITESRETLEGLWRTMPCFWISHPDSIRTAESKLLQLKTASLLGFTIPRTLVTNSPHAAESFYNRNAGQVVYKPQRYGRVIRGDTVSLIYTNLIEEYHVEHFAAVQLAPVLFQPYVPKMVEVRVVVVGDRAFAVELRSQEILAARHDWRRVDPSELPHVVHELPSEVEAKCINLLRVLRLAFGAIDFILTPEGEYIFLEINPNGQWAWIQQMCPDVHIREALVDLLISGTASHER
ncbi:MAG: MvdC/MvdD family ATP grasp protein [Chloroflexota bacterium]